MRDPFLEGVPDFGDAGMQLASLGFVRGVDAGSALAAIDDASALVKAICALDEAELRAALFAMTLWYRMAMDPTFRPTIP
jgi:hypothetical protein